MMDAYRIARNCCVCGKGIMVLHRRYEEGGVTAHQACADYVARASESRKYDELSVMAFRELMKVETEDIEK